MRRVLPFALLALAACSSDGNLVVYNVAPAVAILRPANDASFDQNEAVVFQGRVADSHPLSTLTFDWTSSIDGPLPYYGAPDNDGFMQLATASLSPGSHVITLTATDEAGGQGQANVTVHIVGVPEDPSIDVVQPQNNGQGLGGAPFQFIARVSDHQDPPQDLVVDFDISQGPQTGHICTTNADSNGIAECITTLPSNDPNDPANAHYFGTFTVTDTDGNTATRSIAFTMVDRGDYDADGDGFTPNGGDCNDSNADVYPGAPEICDGLVNDCGAPPGTPADVGTDCYDDDGDGYCESPPCRNASGTLSDCNDADPNVYPGAPEGTACDGIDNNCNGVIDEGTTCWDNDGDGYCATPNHELDPSLNPCVNASGTQPDCDDTNPDVHPNATENCATAYDDNCNGVTNEQDATNCTWFYLDQDGDGYGKRGTTDRQCWCAASAPYSGTRNDDCDDQNATVHPDQPNNWFTTPYTRPNGQHSFDYDCSGYEEQEYPIVTTCSFDTSSVSCNQSGGNGWNTTVPSCGDPGTFINNCSIDVWNLFWGLTSSCINTCTSDPTGYACGECVLLAFPGSLACDDTPDTMQQGCH